MKYAVWFLLAALSSASLLFAEDKEKEMMGTICNSSCVVQQDNLATCDRACTDKRGEAVFVSDQGTVMKIANQAMAMPHMGKHVKMMVSPTEEEREQSLRIMRLVELAP